MITKLVDWSGAPDQGQAGKCLFSRYGIYAGLDVGRFVHPSHLGGDRAARARGRGRPLEGKALSCRWRSVWLDDVPYAEQIREIKEILAMGGAFVRVFYDNTRGELVAFASKGFCRVAGMGSQSPQSARGRWRSGSCWPLSKGGLKLLPDERQKKSLLTGQCTPAGARVRRGARGSVHEPHVGA
jgi:hypothetical protein